MITTKIFKDLRKFLHQANKNRSDYRVNENDFTRQSKLNFLKISFLMFTLLKSPYKLN
jgi:hypothetical protein